MAHYTKGWEVPVELCGSICTVRPLVATNYQAACPCNGITSAPAFNLSR